MSHHVTCNLALETGKGTTVIIVTDTFL